LVGGQLSLSPELLNICELPTPIKEEVSVVAESAYVNEMVEEINRSVQQVKYGLFFSFIPLHSLALIDDLGEWRWWSRDDDVV
jgi:hypothetical protein